MRSQFGNGWRALLAGSGARMGAGLAHAAKALGAPLQSQRTRYLAGGVLAAFG